MITFAVSGHRANAVARACVRLFFAAVVAAAVGYGANELTQPSGGAQLSFSPLPKSGSPYLAATGYYPVLLNSFAPKATVINREITNIFVGVERTDLGDMQVGTVREGASTSTWEFLSASRVQRIAR